MENLDLENVTKKADDEIAQIEDLNTLQQVKANYLGKKGLVASLMANLKDLTIEARKELGMKSNQVKQALEARFEARRKAIEDKIIQAKLASETIDVTLPGVKFNTGSIDRKSVV